MYFGKFHIDFFVLYSKRQRMVIKKNDIFLGVADITWLTAIFRAN